MGIDLNDLWGNAKAEIDKGLAQVKAVGIPALESAGEKWGANVLEDWKNKLQGSAAQKDKVVAAEVKKITEAQPSPGSFGSFLSETLTGAGANAMGGKIILVAIVLIGAGIWLGRGK